MGVWYCTREDVRAALDFKETARNSSVIDRAIESSSRTIDGFAPGGGMLHRRFYPETATRYFDWPNDQYARAWRLWLNAHELLSVTSIVSGGTTLAAADYLLRPDHGPPYTYIEIDLSRSAAWQGTNTHQRSIAITGSFGHCNSETPAGTTAEAIDISETGIDVSDSSLIGVGDIIRVDSERMQVTGKTMLTTGQTTSGSLTQQANDVSVTVGSGAAFAVDETILIDSERMRIVDIAGNVLTVRRGYDGSALAAHNTAATVYALRTLTVVRGALGTTAATHLTSAPIYRHLIPGLVNELCVALSENTLIQRSSGYARTTGSGENERESSGRGLREIKEDAYAYYGRKTRISAV